MVIRKVDGLSDVFEIIDEGVVLYSGLTEKQAIKLADKALTKKQEERSNNDGREQNN